MTTPTTRASRRTPWLAMLLAGASASGAPAGQRPACPMQPPRLAMRVPSQGVLWLRGEDFAGPCKAIPARAWVRRPAKEIDLLVHADGPSGSGHFWTLTVGLARHDQKLPAHGFCLDTCTVGWRTLQRFQDAALPWLDDRDGDGKAELIVWDSFPLAPDPSLAEHGLVAWVYDAGPNGHFTIQWSKTRKLAAELAASYRTPLGRGTAGGGLEELRGKAAQALGAFAAGACAARGEGARGQ